MRPKSHEREVAKDLKRLGLSKNGTRNRIGQDGDLKYSSPSSRSVGKRQGNGDYNNEDNIYYHIDNNVYISCIKMIVTELQYMI